MRHYSKPVIWAGIASMFVIGAVHLLVSPHAFDDAPAKGMLFIAGTLCALIAAAGIQEEQSVWGWGLGALIAVATLAGYLANITVGLPGLPPQPEAWHEPMGRVALIAEALMIAAAGWVLYQTYSNRWNSFRQHSA